jgi:hypothetical protein
MIGTFCKTIHFILSICCSVLTLPNPIQHISRLLEIILYIGTLLWNVNSPWCLNLLHPLWPIQVLKVINIC